MSYADTLKALLAKKQQQKQGQGKVVLDTSKSQGKDQVTSHKPAKKSAGRGR